MIAQKHSVATTFTWYEPNQAYKGHKGDLQSHVKSWTYKYLGDVDNYLDSMDQQHPRGPLITCGNDTYIELLHQSRKDLTYESPILFWHVGVDMWLLDTVSSFIVGS